MIRQMKLDVKKFGSINTKNFDATGENCKLRKEKEIEELKKRVEEEILKRKKEEEEKQRLQNEIQKMKDDDGKKQELLNKMLKKEEEDIKKLEQLFKTDQEEQKKIEEEAKKRNIDIKTLNEDIQKNYELSKNMIMTGAVTHCGSYLLYNLFYEGVSTTLIKTLSWFGFGGMGITVLGLVHAGKAGYCALKKLWT